MIYQTTTDKL